MKICTTGRSVVKVFIQNTDMPDKWDQGPKVEPGTQDPKVGPWSETLRLDPEVRARRTGFIDEN